MHPFFEREKQIKKSNHSQLSQSVEKLINFSPTLFSVLGETGGEEFRRKIVSLSFLWQSLKILSCFQVFHEVLELTISCLLLCFFFFSFLSIALKIYLIKRLKMHRKQIATG